MTNPLTRIRRLFFQKLVVDEPNHPWLSRPDAQDAFHNWTWKEPRRVDQWWWMDVEITDGGDLVRGGRVSWNQDGTGSYDVSISYEREGVGLGCWPSFRALSDAQEFVERLMCLPLEEARALHGQQWPGVVLWIHTYRLHGGAPRENWLRWSCKQCGRIIDQDRATGCLVVVRAGQDVPHGGQAGQHHVFDWPLPVAGPWERELEGLIF